MQSKISIFLDVWLFLVLNERISSYNFAPDFSQILEPLTCTRDCVLEFNISEMKKLYNLCEGVKVSGILP